MGGVQSQEMKSPADIIGSGALTCVGLDAIQTASSVRAGLSRIRETDWPGQDGNPFRGGFLPDDCLEELNWRTREVLPDSLPARILQLGAPALREAAENLPEPPGGLVVIVGVGHQGQMGEVSPEPFLDNLMRQAQIKIDLEASEVFVAGRVAGLMALRRACLRLAQGFPGPIIAGGIDSYHDLPRLIDLDFAGRVLSDLNSDGFLPGEGAGFLVLANYGKVQPSGQSLGKIMGIVEVKNSGQVGAGAPAPGNVLSETVRDLMVQIPGPFLPCPSVYSNLNGESSGAKEWGVCFLRNRTYFAEGMKLHHPSESMGEIGGAMGPVLAGLAVRGIVRGTEPGPCLVWCSEDGEECSALFLTPPQPAR
jgi:3-oxoacyl-[acyl-carrier-protein] synthase-1